MDGHWVAIYIYRYIFKIAQKRGPVFPGDKFSIFFVKLFLSVRQ